MQDFHSRMKYKLFYSKSATCPAITSISNCAEEITTTVTLPSVVFVSLKSLIWLHFASIVADNEFVWNFFGYEWLHMTMFTLRKKVEHGVHYSVVATRHSLIIQGEPLSLPKQSSMILTRKSRQKYTRYLRYEEKNSVHFPEIAHSS